VTTNNKNSRRPENRDGFQVAGQPAGVAVDPSTPAGHLVASGWRCPTCGVPPGSPCLTNEGRTLPMHAARIRAAYGLRQHDPLP
jgi:hypothetical protein